MDVEASMRMTNGMMVHGNNNNNNNIEPDRQAIMNDIITLIENEIPDCQQNLRDNHKNLERVAEYCDTNYFTAPDKSAALEETKNYTTQSLASVAHQITSLAFSILQLLDLQATQVIDLESHSNHLAQSEEIHREKVARREIGLFTTNKRSNRSPKIIYPLNPERPTKYIRKPIDYSILDDVGHGVKLTPSQQPQQQQNQLHTSRTRSISSAQSINGGSSLYGPGLSISGMSGSSLQGQLTKPPTPPQPTRAVGSLSRTSKEFKNPSLSIAPPQVPSNYAPNYPLNHSNNAQQSHYGVHQPLQQAEQQNYHGVKLAPSQQPLGQEPAWAPKNYIEKVIAVYEYTREKPDELNLNENDVIYVTKKNEDGWYEGVMDGREGLFPFNYVQPLRDPL